MNYNNNSTNPYEKYLRHVPGAHRELGVGEPINTKFGWGIIINIRQASGGIDPQSFSRPAPYIISVLFAGETKPYEMPVSTLTFTSNSQGALSWSQENN